MDQINLKMTRLSLIPGDLAHWDSARHTIGLFRAAPWQPRRILAEASEAALHTCDADPLKLLEQRVSQAQFAVLGQVLGGYDQSGGEAFGTNVVQTFPDQANGIVDLDGIGLGTLLGARPACQI